MHIHVPIPIGTRHIAHAQGTTLKRVACESCGEHYAYLLELRATGEHVDLLFLDGKGSAERAQALADDNLRKQSENCIKMVPCPSCGCYQPEMVRRMKDEAWMAPPQIAGCAIAALSFVPLWFEISYSWAVAAILFAAGACLMVYGYVLAWRYDPNAGNPGPRKSIARMYAVWGEQLAELLAATSPPGESGPHKEGQQ